MLDYEQGSVIPERLRNHLKGASLSVRSSDISDIIARVEEDERSCFVVALYDGDFALILTGNQPWGGTTFIRPTPLRALNATRHVLPSDYQELSKQIHAHERRFDPVYAEAI